MVDRRFSPEDPNLDPKRQGPPAQGPKPVITGANMDAMAAAHQAAPKGLSADELAAAVKPPSPSGENPNHEETMRNLPVRRCSIVNTAHPEWGSFGVMEDHGAYYDIHGRGGSRILSKTEAVQFWALNRPQEQMIAALNAAKPDSRHVADILAALGNSPVGRSLESNDTVVSLQPRTEWDLGNFQDQGVIEIRRGDGSLDQVKLDPDREGAIAYSNPNMAAALAIANKMAAMKMAEPVRFTVITTPGLEVNATEVFSKDQRVQWFAAVSSMNGDVGQMEPWTALEGVYPDPMILDARIRREILVREVGSALAGMTPEFLHAHKNRTMEEVDLAALPLKDANALSNEFFNLTDLGEAMVKGHAKIHVPELEIGEVKTYKGWGESKVSLDKFLRIDDRVDQEMADYFINVMPPVTLTSSLIQVGEPSSHVGGRPTFATLNRTGEGWVYAGDCFKGERTSPEAGRG